MNPFGPQGSQAALNMPTGNNTLRYGDKDTWAKDCSANGANDGTVLDAAFWNNIIGALNDAVKASGIDSVTRGDMTLLTRAIKGLATASIKAENLAGNGVFATGDNRLAFALGTGSLPRLVA